MTAAVGPRNLFKVDAGVVHALMQARYQNSSRGQFISQDPVFLGDPRQKVLTVPQSLNSYSYANDNPITKSDPNGRLGALAAAPFLLEGGEVASGPIGWGALGLTALISGAYLLRSRGGDMLQATQMVSGQGYDPDPRPPLNRPPGRWGGLLLTGAGTGFALWGLNEIASPYLDQANFATHYSMALQYGAWANPSTGVTVNNVLYTQNVQYSQQTQKASYSGPTAAGTNPQYASKTYVLPNGAISDWGGTIVAPAPQPTTISKPK
jgi:RHS repeat-associated protein